MPGKNGEKVSNVWKKPENRKNSFEQTLPAYLKTAGAIFKSAEASRSKKKRRGRIKERRTPQPEIIVPLLSPDFAASGGRIQCPENMVKKFPMPGKIRETGKNKFEPSLGSYRKSLARFSQLQG